MPRPQDRLRALSPALLTGIRRGIEKESLRVRPNGSLALTPHPAALGSALAHPHITTDFSEAQLELITGVHAGIASCVDELRQLHQFVYRHIGDELMWCASMPCALSSESDIPIGRYGTSNIGRLKTVYRIGLSHRYGRRMQTISGVHYNFSVPAGLWSLAGFRDADEAYFALIRNFRRHAWLLLYLFGASPAVCSSFVEGRAHTLRELAPGTLYLPHATSLRMGPLGYLSAAQDDLEVSYNDLASYTASLYEALTQPYSSYDSIGIRDDRVSGDEVDSYRQLSTSLLQIENEFYSAIRPKRVTRPGERPLHALRERGVEYVEVRAMDLDPFAAVGIAEATMRFLDIFLLHCLLTDSPPDTPRDIEALGRNKLRVAERGREPGLRLDRDSQMVELSEWGGQLLAECEPIAEALDLAHGGHAFRESLAATVGALDDPSSLPSARVLRRMQQEADNSYARFTLAQSLDHRSTLHREPFPAEVQARLEQMAAQSIAEQRKIEANDQMPFEQFRQQYLSHAMLHAG